MSTTFRAFGVLGLCAVLTGCPPTPPPSGGDAGDGGQDAPDDAGGPDGSLDGSPDVASETGADGGVMPAEGGSSDATLDGGAADGATESGETGAEGGPTCGFDAGSAPDGPPFCGDGQRSPGEECDDGLGTSDVRRGCSAECQVLDELAVAPVASDAGPSSLLRSLGASRHPVAASDSTFGAVYLETSNNPPTLSLTTFSAKGVATGVVNELSALSTVVDDSNPAVAGLPCGRYAVAWADYDSEGGDELDVAVQIVDPTVSVTSPPAIANVTTGFSQYDPDILWTGSEIVVAWVDNSDPATEPDLRFRTFDANFNPTSGEQTLAGTADSEADVALAAFGGSWAVAWRNDANGLETIQVQAGATTWTVGPAFLPGPVGSKPALTALDATHLLIVYAVGVDDTDSGVANGSQIQVAVLDTGAPGAVSGETVPAADAMGPDPSQPSAVTVEGSVFVAWMTAAAPGDANGEDVWLTQVGWTGSSLELSPMPLPRWPHARLGDQESPALAVSALPPGGALVTGWNDFGQTIAAGELNEDVVMELIPVPPLRTAGDGGP